MLSLATLEPRWEIVSQSFSFYYLAQRERRSQTKDFKVSAYELWWAHYEDRTRALLWLTHVSSVCLLFLPLFRRCSVVSCSIKREYTKRRYMSSFHSKKGLSKDEPLKGLAGKIKKAEFIQDYKNRLSNFSIISSNFQNTELFIIPQQRMYQANMMFSREA